VLKKELEENPVRDIVLGEGPSHAGIMLIGQNPGKEEVKQGRPFVGRAGRYLDSVLVRNNIDRDTIYITSVVKQATPGNRKPTRREIRSWLPYLMDEINRIRPEIIVLMGEVAWKTPRFKDIRYIETYHPAAAMRFPRARERFEKDIEKLNAVNSAV
jgi:uracil-DNA glycosylase family 4